MTDNSKHIRLADLRDAISLYGADLQRWPAVDREEAQKLAQTSMTFSRLLEQEQRLDTQLRAADPLYSAGNLSDMHAFAEHIAASALTIKQKLEAPHETVDPAKFTRLSAEKKRGFRLIPQALIDAAKRVVGPSAAPVGLLPPPAREPGLPQPYRAQGLQVTQVTRRPVFWPGVSRIAAGSLCCLVAGWIFGVLAYSQLPEAPALARLESADSALLTASSDSYFSF